MTFTEWAGYWPTSTDEPFASWINGTQKYVASSTLNSVDQWPNSTLIKGPVADFVAQAVRKQREGGRGVRGRRRPAGPERRRPGRAVPSAAPAV